MQPHTITYLTHWFSSFKALAPNPYRSCPACRSWRTSGTTWTTRGLSSRRLNSNWPDSRELQTSMKTLLIIIDNCRTWPVLKLCWSLRERLTMFKSELGYLSHAREKSLTLQYNKCKCKHSSYVKKKLKDIFLLNIKMGSLSDTQILYLYVDLLWLELAVAVIHLFTVMLLLHLRSPRLCLKVPSAEAAVWAESGGGADPASQASTELLPPAAGGAGEAAQGHRSEC